MRRFPTALRSAGWVPVLAMLVVIAVVAGVSTPREPCPDGVTCAASSDVAGEEIALMPEPCVEAFAGGAARLRRQGFNGVAIPVVLDPGRVDGRGIPPPALAARVAWYASAVRAAGVEPIVRLQVAGDADCTGPDATWFRQRYREEARRRMDDAQAGALRVQCAGRRRAADAPDAAVNVDLASHEAMRDYTRDAGEGSVPDASPAVGFIVPAGGTVERVRNGSFARGWDEWHTAGNVALLPGATGDTTSCGPLMARLGPGGRIVQRFAPVVGPAGARAAGTHVELEVQPSATARRIVVRVGADRHVAEVLPHAVRVRLDASAVEDQPDGPQLEIAVPVDEPLPVTLTSVRASRPWRGGDAADDAGSVAGVVSELGPTLRARSSSPPEERLAPSVGAAVRLGAHLGEASVGASDEPFVRVERFDDGAIVDAILAHPGTSRPTVLDWRLPPASCRRRFTADVGIAPACRGRSDGVEFEARVGDRVVTRKVAPDDPVRSLALDIDDAATSGTAVSLRLGTTAGPAHDATCDWALWIAPQVACAAEPTPAAPPELDLASPGPTRVLETRWDELNVWKLYTHFGPRRARSRPDDAAGWLRARVPWATHVRVLAAFGGNSCRHIEAHCRSSRESADHPFRGRCWEGAEGRAAAYEIFRDDAEEHVDFVTWQAALADLLASGVLPHFNVSAAPCALTGGHEYRTYHWNQRPVVRHDAWRSFVTTVAARIAREPTWPRWRFSITNEPNCLWIGGPGPENVRHLGFVGDSAEYADHFVETARALTAALPRAPIQLGNFTLGGKFSLEDDLPEYLAALAGRMAAAGMSPRDLSAISFSLYETPQHGLAEMPAYKFDRLHRWIGSGSPFAGLPLKLDEVEIHPLVVDAFHAATGGDLDATRWAAVWHADVIALAVEERVASMAPWLGRLFADEPLSRPHPKYWTYALAALAAGDVEPASGDWLHPGRLVPRAAGAARARLAAVRRAADAVDGVGYLATRDEATGAVWILAWRHGGSPVPDAVAERGPAVPLRVRAPEGARAVSSVGVGIDGGERWQVDPWQETSVVVGRVERDGDALVLHLPPESVQLVRIGR